MNTHGHRAARWVALAAAPFVVVQLARSLGNEGQPLALASAASAQNSGASGPANRQPRSHAQARALAWLDAHPLERSLASPFRTGHRTVTQDDPPPSDTPEDRAREAEQFLVSSVIGNGSSAFASINQSICRAGDELDDGWFVLAINAARRVVVVRHQDGTTVELVSR